MFILFSRVYAGIVKTHTIICKDQKLFSKSSKKTLLHFPRVTQAQVVKQFVIAKDQTVSKITVNATKMVLLVVKTVVALIARTIK